MKSTVLSPLKNSRNHSGNVKSRRRPEKSVTPFPLAGIINQIRARNPNFSLEIFFNVMQQSMQHGAVTLFQQADTLL